MKKNKKSLIIWIVLIVALLQLIISKTSAFDRLELITYDLRARLSVDTGPFSNRFKHADKKIVLVAIDDYSRKELANHPEIEVGSWPWPRDVWSGVVDFIEKGEPKAILFDLIFANLNENTWHDRRFAQTLRKYDNVVLATALNNPKILVDNLNSGEEQLIENSNYLPTPRPLDVSIKNKKIDKAITFYSHEPVHDMYTEHNTMGVVNKVVDVDSVIRRNQPVYKLIKNGENYYLPSLAFAGFLKYMGEDGKVIIKNNKIIYKGMVIPIDKNGETNISWHGKGHNYDYIPISKILLSEENDEYINPDYFKDKIVIIGRTITGTDIHLASVNPSYAGPEANATALDNFINDSDPHNKRVRKFVTRLPKIGEYLLIIISCLFLVMVSKLSKNAVIGFVNSFYSILLYLLICVWLFANPSTRLWIPIVVPLYYLGITSAVVFAFRFQKEYAKRASITNMFGKFVSPKILSNLLKHRDNLEFRNSKKKITMMFCDVKDFTSLSEKCNPEQLVDNMNEMFNQIVDVIFENNGTVDKFMGDCVMAYWGDPIASEDDAYMAVKTALDIKQVINDLKVKNAKENKIIFDVKIGINTGEALLGLLGSEKIMSYTAMGDAVNVASRLESNCSKLGRDILMSKSTYDEVKDKIAAMSAGKIEVKGKEEQIEIYEPIGFIEKHEEE